VALSPRRRLLVSLFLILSVIAAGMAGYSLIEGWGFLDSLYMTVITITTIGFKEVHDMSEPGRVFTVALVFLSVGVVFYSLNAAAKILIEGELRDVFGRKRLEKMVRKLKGHYIVCGHGRMGRIICRELAAAGASFVVIEKKPPLEEKLGEGAYTVIQGDATRDETLRDAGIERAAGLITVLPTDAENLYVVLSAREISPTLNIVARAVEENAEQKLLRAGANRVVSPYQIGGLRIAHTVLRPALVDFLEFTTHTGRPQMEEIAVRGGSQAAGRTLGESGIGRELGVVIVAIRKADGKMWVNPTHSTRMEDGDTLIVIGESGRLEALERMAGGR